MTPPTEPDEAGKPRDRIEWYQIFVGYGVVGIMLLVLALPQAGFDDRHALRGAGTIVIVTVVGASMALMRPMTAFRRDVLSVRPALEDALQWAAIVVLLLVSFGTSLLGILSIPASGW